MLSFSNRWNKSNDSRQSHSAGDCQQNPRKDSMLSTDLGARRCRQASLGTDQSCYYL
jgi:hypothetical protein